MALAILKGMIRLNLNYDKNCQTLTGIIADSKAGCLLATVMIVYDVHAGKKMQWSDVMITGRQDCSPHLEDIKASASTMVSGAMLRYLADRNTTDKNLSELLQGLTHPSELLMALGSFSVIYEVEKAEILVSIAKQFSSLKEDKEEPGENPTGTVM